MHGTCSAYGAATAKSDRQGCTLDGRRTPRQALDEPGKNHPGHGAGLCFPPNRAWPCSATDAAATRPGLDTDRISFTVLVQTATDLVTTATGILPSSPIDLVGAIGRAALDQLLPARAQTYNVHTDITIFEKGVAPRSRT
ncbi:MAG: transposase family protein [Actinomycetia bacterium]|nr:transposase family protein [Actinomycetes bacterium]